jgi:hypothetical protein
MAQAFMGGLLTRDLQDAPQRAAEALPNLAGPPARGQTAPSAPTVSSGSPPAALKPFHGLPSFLPTGRLPQSSPPSPAATPAQPAGARPLATNLPTRIYDQNEPNPLDAEVMTPGELAAGINAPPQYAPAIGKATITNDLPPDVLAGYVHNWLAAGGDYSRLPPETQEYVRWIMANSQTPGAGGD